METSSPAPHIDRSGALGTAPGPSTAMASVERSKLRRQLGRWDVYSFLLSTTVTIDTLGLVASNGAQGFTWLLVLGVLFFLPGAMLVAELGSAFPAEGGPYVWVKLARGRLPACVSAVSYWFANPIWVGTSLSLLTIAAVDQFVVPVADGGALYYILGLGFVAVSTLTAVLSLRVGKWLPIVGGVSRFVVLGLFTLSTVVYGIRNGLNVPAIGEFAPTYPLFIALVPLLLFSYLGFEVPSNAAPSPSCSRCTAPRPTS
ncbi:MAG: amino acid permease [Phycicoccus sp.]